jgi:hypothetical protein
MNPAINSMRAVVKNQRALVLMNKSPYKIPAIMPVNTEPTI